MRARGGPRIPPVEYRYLTEFQSHEPEFDYLKSLEIEEKINTLRWCHQGANGARFLVSTNDKTIKLWKVFEKQMQHVSDFNLDASVKAAHRASLGGGSPPDGSGNDYSHHNPLMGPKTPPPPGAPARPLNGSPGGLGSPVSSAGGSFSGRLRLPSVHSTDVVFSARCRRLYGNQHAYHINSLSVNSDCETFISADDLRINLWHLESSGSSFNIVDIKPNNMEDLTEVITSAEFHPNQCNLFAYSSSKGAIRLADMRASALCNNHAKIFDEQEPPGTRSFFCEIIASISDVKFSRDGRYILARDYLTVKLWDINMDSKPVAQFKVHEHLRSKLCDLYESDSIFDKFQCCLSDDGSHLATGSYGNTFRTFDTHAGGADTLEVTKTPQRLRTERIRAATGGSLSSSPSLVGGLMARASGRSSPSPAFLQPTGPGSPDFQTKILHMAWHPQEHVLACAASNSLYIFNA